MISSFCSDSRLQETVDCLRRELDHASLFRHQGLGKQPKKSNPITPKKSSNYCGDDTSFGDVSTDIDPNSPSPLKMTDEEFVKRFMPNSPEMIMPGVRGHSRSNHLDDSVLWAKVFSVYFCCMFCCFDYVTVIHHELLVKHQEACSCIFHSEWFIKFNIISSLRNTFKYLKMQLCITFLLFECMIFSILKQWFWIQCLWDLLNLSIKNWIIWEFLVYQTQK